MGAAGLDPRPKSKFIKHRIFTHDDISLTWFTLQIVIWLRCETSGGFLWRRNEPISSISMGNTDTTRATIRFLRGTIFHGTSLLSNSARFLGTCRHYLHPKHKTVTPVHQSNIRNSSAWPEILSSGWHFKSQPSNHTVQARNGPQLTLLQ